MRYRCGFVKSITQSRYLNLKSMNEFCVYFLGIKDCPGIKFGKMVFKSTTRNLPQSNSVFVENNTLYRSIQFMKIGNHLQMYGMTENKNHF